MSKGASPQKQAAAGGLIGRVLRICNLNFLLVSDFEFRISDLSSQGSGVQPKRCGTCLVVKGRGRRSRHSWGICLSYCGEDTARGVSLSPNGERAGVRGETGATRSNK